MNINDIRQLEDIIIETIYLNLINGKLNQKLKILKISDCISRDVKRENIQNILNSLNEMYNKNINVINELNNLSKENKEKRNTQDWEKQSVLVSFENLKEKIVKYELLLIFQTNRKKNQQIKILICHL